MTIYNKTINSDAKYILAAISCVVFLAIVPMHIMAPIFILLLGMALGILIISIFVPEDFDFILKMYFIGFGVRVFLSFSFYIFSFVQPGNYSPGFIFPNDGWSYSQQGWQIARFAERGIRVTIDNFTLNSNMITWGASGNITNYDFFTSHVYSFLGYSPLSLFFISSAASSIAAILIYMIARELFSVNVARISLLFALFWPSFIMWATQNLKEPMIAMFGFMFLLSIFYTVRYAQPVSLFMAIVSFLILSKINIAVALIMIVVLLGLWFFLTVEHLFKDRFVTVLVCIVIMAIVIIVSSDRLISFISEKTSYDIKGYKNAFDFLNYHRSARAYGSLQFLKGFDVSSPARMILFAPLGFIYALFAPFPWQLGSVMQIIAVPETIAFYVLFPITLRGIIFGYKKRFTESIVLLTIIGGMLIFLGIVEGNSGTLFRHRSVVFYLLFIFTSAGICIGKQKPKHYM